MLNVKIVRGKNPKTKESVFMVTQSTYSKVSKEQLAATIAVNSQLPKASVSLALEAIVKSIFNFVLRGHSVTVTGLGTFWLTLQGPGSETAKDCRPTESTKAMLRYRPTTALKASAKATKVKL